MEGIEDSEEFADYDLHTLMENFFDINQMGEVEKSEIIFNHILRPHVLQDITRNGVTYQEAVVRLLKSKLIEAPKRTKRPDELHEEDFFNAKLAMKEAMDNAQDRLAEYR